MKRSSAATILGSAGAAAAAAGLVLFLAPAALAPRPESDAAVEVAALRRQVAQLEDEVAGLRAIAATPPECAPAPVQRVAEVEEGRPSDTVKARCDDLESWCADLALRCAALEQQRAQANGAAASLGVVVDAGNAPSFRTNALARSLYGIANGFPATGVVQSGPNEIEIANADRSAPFLIQAIGNARSVAINDDSAGTPEPEEQEKANAGDR